MLTPTLQALKRDQEDYKLYDNYTTDLVREKGLDYIDEAHKAGKPFFVGIAPIGPHMQTWSAGQVPNPPEHLPISAPRHSHMFPNVKVPSTKNFNPTEVCRGCALQHG